MIKVKKIKSSNAKLGSLRRTTPAKDLLPQIIEEVRFLAVHYFFKALRDPHFAIASSRARVWQSIAFLNYYAAQINNSQIDGISLVNEEYAKQYRALFNTETERKILKKEWVNGFPWHLVDESD